MKSSRIAFSRKPLEILVAASASVMLTLLLFYFDEGSRNFEGIFSKENIVGLFLYFLVIFGLALLVVNIIPKRHRKGLYLANYFEAHIDFGCRTNH